MVRSILTPPQKVFLRFFAQETELARKFYFTGGTALAEFYLKHRLSQDLDFFSTQEFSPQDINPSIKRAKSVLGYRSLDFQQAFNRNLYQLILPKGAFLKLEFTYFPFLQREKPKSVGGVPVDSLLDIAVNKVFTISQAPRGRDFFDIYSILQKEPWTMESLLKKAKRKFDWHVDPIQLGAQLMKVKKMRDDPVVAGKTNLKAVEDFILQEAGKLERLTFKR